MVERVRSTKPKPCSTVAFEELAEVANSRPDSVLVRLEYLEEVLACHNRQTNDPVPMHKMFPSIHYPGRKYCSMARKELFDFVCKHGAACPSKCQDVP